MEKIGDIIRKHRIAKNLTQEELGKIVFVSKQAVSKWETGKAFPDIETIRKLCNLLEIDKDEVLGGSIEETKKKSKWLGFCIVITVVSVLVASFFCLDGVGYIKRNTQSGVAYLTVFSNGELLQTDEYTLLGELNSENLQNGFKIDVDYGEVRGSIQLPEQNKIEFGFINTNNWHNVQIRLDVENSGGQLSVTQTISYATDNDVLEVTVNKAKTKNHTVSVFCDGV